ncbi:unnamed protein product, partial [Choristocarpus tenellus]
MLPFLVPDVAAQSISVGTRHTCAIVSSGKVKCWGKNSKGQQGNGDTVIRGKSSGTMGDDLPFVNIGTGKAALSISAGGFHTCAILNDESLRCWGYGSGGRLGSGASSNIGDTPDTMGDNLQKVNLGTDRSPIQVVAGEDYTCVLLDDYGVK